MAGKKSLGHPASRPRSGLGRRRWPSPLADSLAAPAMREAGAAEIGAIAWLATLRAKGAQALLPEHLRRLPLPARHARLHCIVLDTSGSMRAQGRLALAKGHAAQLIAQAAQQGDDVALLQLGGDGVQLLLAPSRAAATATVAGAPPAGGRNARGVSAEAGGCANRSIKISPKQTILPIWPQSFWLTPVLARDPTSP